MTKKHFKLIAAAIERARSIARTPQDSFVIDTVAICLADDLISVNPYFDKHRFLTACGVPTE